MANPYPMSIACDALRDLVPIVQSKKVKNTHGGVLLLVLKVTFLHWFFFSCFSNCTNDVNTPIKAREISERNRKECRFNAKTDAGNRW